MSETFQILFVTSNPDFAAAPCAVMLTPITPQCVESFLHVCLYFREKDSRIIRVRRENMSSVVSYERELPLSGFQKSPENKALTLNKFCFECSSLCVNSKKKPQQNRLG